MFRAFASGYDGTLASDGRLSTEAERSLVEAGRAGWWRILTTGRTFFELLRRCDRLDLFDAVVAENGGVLYYPAAQLIRDVAPPPSARLLAELDRRGIPFRAGRTLVETAREDEPAVRRALQRTGVVLRPAYNRAALLLLADGVSKGSGLRQVLHGLGVAFQDVLGLGDAENDLELFEACGWAACPDDALPEVKARADWVWPVSHGAGLAQVLWTLLRDRPDVTGSLRHRLMLGWARETLEPVWMPERGVNVVIQGDPLSGKSWLAGILTERLLARRYGVVVIDPEGDYEALSALPGVERSEIHYRRDWARALERFDDDPAAGVVLDLSRLPYPRKLDLIEAGLGLIRERRRHAGPPHWVVLDEAHYSLHREGVRPDEVGLGDKGFCLVTYRASWLRESVRAAADIFILARTALPDELAHLQAHVFPASPVDVTALLPHLPEGSFVLADSREPGVPTALTFVAAPRLTPHVRHLTKYVEGQLAPEHAFAFRDESGRVVATAGNLATFVGSLAQVGDDVLAFHAARADFSHWLLDVFGDREFGNRLAKLERRWRRGEVPDLRRALHRLVAWGLARDRLRPLGRQE
jgi:hydroxymethylpyrimidine pyrophosphatase-like HAD family hydrolase